LFLGDDLQAENVPRSDVSLSGLWWVGGLTGLTYLGGCLFYLNGAESHSRTAKEIFAWVTVLSLLPLFWKGYKMVNQAPDEWSAAPVVGFAALFCIIVFLTIPYHSTDVFGYINRGWQQAHYGQNPYIVRLADVPGWQEDPMFREHWLYNPNPYGFLFSLLARFIAVAGGGNWWLTLGLFKLVNAVAYAFTGWLVWSGAKLLGHSRPLNALYLFLWNPLILVHHIANGHNDIIVGCLLALSIYLAIKEVYVWIIPVLAAATLIKYGPVLLIPLAAVFIYKKKGLKPVILGSLISAVLAAAASYPYLKDWQSIRIEDIRDNATLIDNSLHSFIIHIFENIARLFPNLAQFHDIVNTAIATTLRAGIVVFFIIILTKIIKNASLESFIEKSVLVMFALICVASTKFNAWYLGMLLAPALMLAEKYWLRRLTVLLTGSQLLSITFFKQAYMLNYFAMMLIPQWLICWSVRRQKETSQEPAVGPQDFSPPLRQSPTGS
jgi:alpha-1,6-mannosyltransferase